MGSLLHQAGAHPGCCECPPGQQGPLSLEGGLSSDPCLKVRPDPSQPVLPPSMPTRTPRERAWPCRCVGPSGLCARPWPVGYLQDVHALQGDHGQLLQPVASQVHVSHGQQGAREAAPPQQAEAGRGLGRPRCGAVVLIAEQLLQAGQGHSSGDAGTPGQGSPSPHVPPVRRWPPGLLVVHLSPHR